MKQILALVFFLQVFLLTNCGAGNGDVSPKDVTIRLRWVKAYPAENWTAVKTGFFWSLSYLGAKLESTEENLITRIDSSVFEINLSKAGFSGKAIQTLQLITDTLKASEEYKKMQAIDLGRFVVATQHIADHYYAITDAAASLNDFFKRHDFTNAKTFAVIKSCVAKHHRVIRCLPGKSMDQIAFIAEEGLGSPDSGNFSITAYEVLDVMPNGQIRYAVYDKSGNRLSGSPREMGEAGKPGKCSWCHESTIQPLFFETPDVKNYITKTDFLALVKTAQDSIDHFRARQHSLINYTHKQDHTFSELLYISFMEPSGQRLRNEWLLDSVTVNQRLASQTSTHIYEEFPFLGQLYHRYYTDSLAPYRSMKMPLSVREPLGAEPSLLKNRKP